MEAEEAEAVRAVVAVEPGEDAAASVVPREEVEAASEARLAAEADSHRAAEARREDEEDSKRNNRVTPLSSAPLVFLFPLCSSARDPTPCIPADSCAAASSRALLCTLTLSALSLADLLFISPPPPPPLPLRIV